MRSGSTSDDRVLEILAGVPDPEIPVVSVIDLGIVRAADSREVVISPTYTGCPASHSIELSIRQALDAGGFAKTVLRTCLSPAWTTDWITPEGREKLRAYGIAPPPLGEPSVSLNGAAATCPRCASDDTEEVSRFGSTPCKALWRCRACLEPFDRFKCL